MNPMPQLAPLLKTLKLSGVLDSLEARNRQAIESKLAYTDFLALLVADEVARRENRKLALRLRQSGVALDKTLERFDFAHNPAINRQRIADLATCRFIEERAPVLIAGPAGTGKSHLAQAIGHCAARLGHSVCFITQSKLLGSLHAARATGAYEQKLKAYARVSLLIVDDYGLKPLRPPHDEDFHELIAERYERTCTLITSNLDFAEWGEAFHNKLLGAATLDRLRHGAYQLVLDGESYRAPREFPDTSKPALPRREKMS